MRDAFATRNNGGRGVMCDVRDFREHTEPSSFFIADELRLSARRAVFAAIYPAAAITELSRDSHARHVSEPLALTSFFLCFYLFFFFQANSMNNSAGLYPYF